MPLALPSLDPLFHPEPDAEALLDLCHLALTVPNEPVRARGIAWNGAVGFHAPSLSTAITALSLAREAFMAASRERGDESLVLDAVALAAARVGAADHASIGEDATACIVIAGLAAGRLASRLDDPRLRVGARWFATRQLTTLLAETESEPDMFRALASALSEGTPWTVVDRTVIDELAVRASTTPFDPRPTPDARHLKLLQGAIPMDGDRDMKRLLERFSAILEAPMHLVVLAPLAIARAATVLDEEMPNFADATRAVLGDLRLASHLDAPAKVRPTLLLGPPGIGKTRWTRRLSELLGLPVRTLSLAGASDDRYLSGTARGWGSAQPGGVVSTIVETGSANPLIVADEVDKTGGSDKNGRIAHALLGLLERETSRSWFDACLRAAVDVSNVSWLFTANDVAAVSAPLRDRLRIIEIAAPGTDAFDRVLETILADVAAEFDVDRSLLPDLPSVATDALRRHWTLHRSPRRLRSAVLGLLDAVLADAVSILH